MTGPLGVGPGDLGDPGMVAAMMRYREDLIATIDARISAAQVKADDFGTVQDRDAVGPGATVVFDGGIEAQPVKVPGHVHCFAGDRVVLRRVKGTWVVTGTFNRRQLAESSQRTFGPGGGATSTSGTFVDQPVAIAMNFTKRYDLTAVNVLLITTMSMTVAASAVQTGVRVSGAPGTSTATTFTPVDLTVGYYPFSGSTLGVPFPIYGSLRTASLPSGDFVMVPRWRRANGSGTMSQDSGHYVHLSADEIFRSSEV